METQKRQMDTGESWIRLDGAARPVDGVNMARVSAFIQQGDAVLLYLGWAPEGKTPWLTLHGEDARRVIHWLAERELIAY